jgi:hypothetical protein
MNDMNRAGKGRHMAREASLPDMPVIAIDMPVMYEDEGQEEMGETEVHSKSTAILRYGVEAHLASQPKYRVFSDLNCYYHPIKRWAYFSADVMVVAPLEPLPDEVRSYRINDVNPAPVVTMEVLSQRSFQQEDLTRKPEIYADLKIPEYILVDVTGKFLPQCLLLKRLLADGTWKDKQDADGGITSRLGFRIIIDSDGQVRVVNAKTGKSYVRPEEAQAATDAWEAEAEARRQAEERARQLEAELQRLRKRDKRRRKP